MRVSRLKLISGFTLIELIVAVSIIAILSTVVAVSALDSNKQGRDAKRQADLRSLQSAIELYKNKYGRYPEGCRPADNWSGQPGTAYACADGTNNYIVGATGRLFNEFMPVLPRDKKLPTSTNSGYTYMTNSAGTVYKIMAMRTVEAEVVSYTHPLRSCDIRPNTAGRIQNAGANGVDTSGWCETATIAAREPSGAPATSVDTLAHCRMNSGLDMDSGDGRFEISYGVWGGFEPVVTGVNRASQLRNTTRIICK